MATASIPLALSFVPAEAGAGWREHFAPTLSERSRYEMVDWFAPPPGVGAPRAERYDFFASQLRAGVRVTHPYAQLTLELQDTRLLRLPDDASLAAPRGNLGPGATYYAHTRHRDQGETILRQAALSFRWSGIQTALGRFEYSEGLETAPGDPTLVWLKRARIGERLVGPFGYTHVGRVFDGARLWMDRPAWNVAAIAGRPTAGGYEVSANPELDEVVIAGIAVTGKRLSPPRPADIRLFHLYLDDDRFGDGLPVKVDNRPAPARAADRNPIRVHTLGGHAVTAMDAGPGKIDGLAWAAWQIGDWGVLDHSAWAAAIEAGYQWTRWPWAPWLRIGYDVGSGDDDPADSHHHTFFQLLPTSRIYAQLPFYNGMNLEDGFVQLMLKPHPSTTARFDVHDLRLNQPRDLWYAGGGATREDIFGYSGIPSSGARDLARVADGSMTAVLWRRLTLYGYYGHAFGGAVVRGTFAGDQADYGYVEATFRY